MTIIINLFNKKFSDKIWKIKTILLSQLFNWRVEITEIFLKKGKKKEIFLKGTNQELSK